MIQELAPPRLVVGPDSPALVAVARAYRPCGCSIWLGVTLYEGEPTIGVIPCSPPHDDLMGTAYDALLLARATVPHDQRPAVVVADEILRMVAAEMVA